MHAYHLREICFFVRMEQFWDLLFQLMKHGTNSLHVGPIYIHLFSIAQQRKVRSEPGVVTPPAMAASQIHSLVLHSVLCKTSTDQFDIK